MHNVLAKQVSRAGPKTWSLPRTKLRPFTSVSLTTILTKSVTGRNPVILKKWWKSLDIRNSRLV